MWGRKDKKEKRDRKRGGGGGGLSMMGFGMPAGTYSQGERK